MKPAVEPPGWGNRRRIMVAVPDLNVVLMENFFTPPQRMPGVKREQQIWTYRYAEAPPEPGPRPPTRLRVSTDKGGGTLSWKPSPSPGVTGYAVHRGEGAKPWLVEFREVGRVGKAATSFRDADLSRGTLYFYYLQALGPGGQAGPP